MVLYFVVFEDGTTYQGGTSYSETKWMSIPEKKIKRIFFRLPSGDHICLSGYDRYYYMVEATRDVLRGKTKINNSKIRIEAIYCMGKKQDKVIIYRIPLSINKDIKTTILNTENDCIKELNQEAWK